MENNCSVRIYEFDTPKIKEIIYDRFKKIIGELENEYTVIRFHWLSGYDDKYKTQINFYITWKGDNKIVELKFKENFSDCRLLFDYPESSSGEDILSEFLYPACKLALKKEEWNGDELNPNKFMHCFLNSLGLNYPEEESFCLNHAHNISHLLNEMSKKNETQTKT